MTASTLPTTDTRPLTSLHPNPLNPRGELQAAGLEELADSIRAHWVATSAVSANNQSPVLASLQPNLARSHE